MVITPLNHKQLDLLSQDTVRIMPVVQGVILEIIIVPYISRV